jgi:DNA-binding MarR family transcriptional regulator
VTSDTTIVAGQEAFHADGRPINLSPGGVLRLSTECGLTEADYAVLVAVSEAPGRRLRSRDLCQALGWERSRLSHQIARMEARGTVERAPCHGDARGFDVVLTDGGLAAIEAAAPLHLAAVRHCFADVLRPEQLDALSEIAETVTAHLEAEHAGPYCEEHATCSPSPCE